MPLKFEFAVPAKVMQRTSQKDLNVNLYNANNEDTHIENVESRTKSGKCEYFKRIIIYL